MAAGADVGRKLREWVASIRRLVLREPSFGVPRPLVAAAQVSSLAAMVFCYFLAPQFAWAYAVLALGWFLGLALPTATMGPRGQAGKRLMAAAAGRSELPGSLRFTVRVAARALVYPCWPAFVAGVLPSPVGARSAEPLMAMTLLVAGAGVLVTVVAVAGPRHAMLARWIVLSIATAAVIALLPGFP